MLRLIIAVFAALLLASGLAPSTFCGQAQAKPWECKKINVIVC